MVHPNRVKGDVPPHRHRQQRQGCGEMPLRSFSSSVRYNVSTHPSRHRPAAHNPLTRTWKRIGGRASPLGPDPTRDRRSCLPPRPLPEKGSVVVPPPSAPTSKGSRRSCPRPAPIRKAVGGRACPAGPSLKRDRGVRAPPAPTQKEIGVSPPSAPTWKGMGGRASPAGPDLERDRWSCLPYRPQPEKGSAVASAPI